MRHRTRMPGRRIPPNPRWKQEFVARASELFEPAQEVQDRDRRIAELERVIGRLTVQLELSKKVLSYGNSPLRDSE